MAETTVESESNSETLDLSSKQLKKLNKAQSSETNVTTLILDENDLQKLDNIDSFPKLQKLSAVRNQLIRMYGVCKLTHLTTLNLAHNGIITIEGLKELVLLKCLCLAGNNIRSIEHLSTCNNLEHLDLSENSITHISDISYLKNLQELLLHGNKIGHLRQCERYLPTSLITLTLASNNITDLNEVSQLVQLVNLTNFSITNNPCVTVSGKVGFDYRPFVINWCMSLKVIDGYVVDAIESLRAEWLYSQGRGRHFRVGDHQDLIQYLASVCPLSGETLQTEEDRKLRLILSKAQHHQQQLREQLSANGSVECSPTPSPASRRRVNSRSSPRPNNAVPRHRVKSPDRMTSSCISSSGALPDATSLMTQSLDPIMLANSVAIKTAAENNGNENHSNIPLPDHTQGYVYNNSPLQAATKLVPVPESLMSPDYRPSTIITSRIAIPRATNIPTQVNNKASAMKKETPRGSPKLGNSPHASRHQKIVAEPKRFISSPLRQRKNQNATAIHTENRPPPNINSAINGMVSLTNNSVNHSSDEDSEMCESKLETIRHLAQERGRSKKLSEKSETTDVKSAETAAAVLIQKMWRGYFTRNKDKKTIDMFKVIKDLRTQQYIEKLTNDMESTKAALESERKIQMLQMQAINALWKKVSAMQPGEKGESSSNDHELNNLDNNTEIVKDLTQTCNLLSSQVHQLQTSMHDVMRCLTAFCQIPSVSQQLKDCGISTQTEISAVHTPQGEAGKLFPFQKTTRPSSLPLATSQRSELQAQAVQLQQQSDTASEEVQQYAGTLVKDVIKTVAETTEADSADDVGSLISEITVTEPGNIKQTAETDDIETTEHDETEESKLSPTNNEN